VGRHGTVDIADAVLDETARRAVTMPEPLWSASRRMLVLPLSTDAGGETALLLVDRPGHAPDAGIISTSKAIGVRLLRFLARR